MKLTVKSWHLCSGSQCISWMFCAVKLWSYFGHALKKLTVLSSGPGLVCLAVLCASCWYVWSFDNLQLILLGQLLIFFRSQRVSDTGSGRSWINLLSCLLGLLLSCSGTVGVWLRLHLAIFAWSVLALVWLCLLLLSIASSLVRLMLFTALLFRFWVSKRMLFLVG